MSKKLEITLQVRDSRVKVDLDQIWTNKAARVHVIENMVNYGKQ